MPQATKWQRIGNRIDTTRARTAYCSGEDKSQKGTLSYPAIIRPCAIVEDETKRKDQVLTLGVEEEFQMIAVGFGLSEFRKAKANPREVLRIAPDADLPSKKGVTDENNSFVT